MAVFTGTSGDDNITGTAVADTFDLFQGGNDFVDGGAGFDIFNMGNELRVHDEIHGGADFDTVNLNGNYSLTFNATTIADVELIALAAGHDYALTTVDANVAGSVILQVNASALGLGDAFSFNGSAETTGRFSITGGAGNDIIVGGGNNDSILLNGGGDDTANAGGGTDFVGIGAALTRDDRLDGGTGGGDNDSLSLSGDYSAGINLAAKTIRGFEGVALISGNSYRLTFNDGNVAAGKTLAVGATGLSAANFARVDGSAETDGRFSFLAGAGADILTGGAGADAFTGNGSADRLTGGGGVDQFNYNAATDSTSTAFDKVIGFDAGADNFHVFGGVTGVDAAVSGGKLTSANFDTQLAAAIGAGELGSDHAVLFTPDKGGFSGHTFLVVDFNGTGGYQAGADLVIELVNGVDLGSFDASAFV